MLTTLLMLVGLGSGTASAKPAPVQTTTSPAEPALTLGLSGAAAQLTSGSLASIRSWDAKAKGVSAHIVRVGATWASIAPSTLAAGFVATDPNSSGYNWSALDQEVKAVVADGFVPLIEIGGAPTWAEGPNIPKGTPAGSWEPNPAAFGQFATALATRYDGQTPGIPAVRFWQAWNEPNLSEYLNPQWTQSKAPASPGLYRNLEDAFYSSVKAVSSSDFVVAAGTAPYGDPQPGGSRMQPVTFDQNLFCLNTDNTPSSSCPGPTYLDAIDDHPYVSGLCCLGPTWHASLAQDTSIPDMYKIANVLAAAEKRGAALPAGKKQIWATEIGWNTDPPNPDTSAASAPSLVAKWTTQALYVLWSQGVSTVLWYSLADPPVEPSTGWDSTYEEGLYYGNGVAKPAAAAFRFPFLTNRQTNRLVLAWGRAPAAGTLWIQQRVRHTWRAVVKLKISAGQVFQVPLVLLGASSFRAYVDGIYSPAWTQTK